MSMKIFMTVAVLSLRLILGSTAQAQPTQSPLTIEKLLEIKHPSNPTWSPDGHHVAFLWDEGGVVNLYLIDASSAGAKAVALTSFHQGQVTGQFWSHDGQTLYFPHEGSLWQVSLAGEEAKPVWSDLKASSFVLSSDGQQIAYVRSSNGTGADLCTRTLSGGGEGVVAHDNLSIMAPVWSPDSKRIAYYAGGKTIIHDEAPAYSGAKIIYTITERGPGKLFVVSSSGGTTKEIDAPAGSGSVRWLNANEFVFDRQSDDFKKRTSYIADANSGKSRTAHEDVEDKFWSIPYDAGASAQPSPDGKWIAFLSDRDGWDHLYVMPATGGDPVQITKGHFEAWRPVWSHDSKRIAFDANSSEAPGDRHLFIADLSNGPAHASIQTLTSERGTDISPAWSSDDNSLLYQHTDPHNSPDLFALTLQPKAKPIRLTESMPSDIDRSSLVEPQFVHFPGADGASVPGWLFVPKNLDRSKKHPVIVWFHGDGINQNYDGWHVQRNYAVYYSFHQYLLQQGYIVFAPDYRGSIGYGRDWRTGVYMDIGDRDAKDAWMSANYLKTLSYVDPDRIGVWGLSYGGFFTLIAMTDQPTLFRAGIDVAGVVDYRMYYSDPYHGAWTASRIGTPDQNPTVYDKASPLSHIDRLQHPLLILHGTADVNVPYLESVRLIDEGLKQHKGNLLQFMMYPGEFHYFDREHVLLDAWHRADNFFKLQLDPSQIKPH
jgi:dipeptidyl aminopeptidase/acylaminoacyl peptidase